MCLFYSIIDRKNQFCVSGGREEIDDGESPPRGCHQAGAGLLASGNQPSHPDEKIKKYPTLKNEK